MLLSWSNLEKVLNNDFHYLHGSLKQPNCLIIEGFQGTQLRIAKNGILSHALQFFMIPSNGKCVHAVSCEQQFQNHMDRICLCFEKKSYDCAERGPNGYADGVSDGW